MCILCRELFLQKYLENYRALDHPEGKPYLHIAVSSTSVKLEGRMRYRILILFKKVLCQNAYRCMLFLDQDQLTRCGFLSKCLHWIPTAMKR